MKSVHSGDEGFTHLLGSGMVAKSDPRLETFGALDEASAALGLGRAAATKPRTREIALGLQKDLVIVSAEIATPPERQSSAPHRVGSSDVERLEALSAELEQMVEIGGEFVQPGETIAEAAFDLARTIVRRAERRAVALKEEKLIDNPQLLRYLNRLSDLLFVVARYEARTSLGGR